MNLLPKASGSRPRLACEVAVGAVVAGRSPEPGLPVAQVARIILAENTVVPGLRPGNLPDRVGVVAALRQALDKVGGRSNARNADLTLVIPDGAVRVLLLDFDTLPSKLSEALPIVRFRLKKLIPFDPDQAMVSFQIMSTSRSMVRVLAVAIPRDVLSEYESVAREAGFEPGAVLPSTLALLAAVREGEGASLVVNAHSQGVTTAIVRAGILLLHRSIELTEFPAAVPAGFAPALFNQSATAEGDGFLPLIDREDSQAEWAAQQPLPEHGRNPYADRIATEEPTQNQDASTDLGVSVLRVRDLEGAGRAGIEQPINMYAAAAEPASSARSPYASALLQEELDAQLHKEIFQTAAGNESFGSDYQAEVDRLSERGMGRMRDFSEDELAPPRVHTLAPDLQAEEIARAVSVAMAYFEDALGAVPEVLLSAGSLGAERLQRLLVENGSETAGAAVRVRELVNQEDLALPAVSNTVPKSSLAGVVGALRS